jgi:hypothetical protein
MDSGRTLRAVLTALILIGCLAALHRFGGPEAPNSAVARTKPSALTAAGPPVTPPSASPVEIATFPFAAMDNGCFDGIETELSGCTGFLSGGRAIEYRLTVSAGQILRIRVEPTYGAYDPAFALLRDGQCIAGRDAEGMGEPERATIRNLPAGTYDLWVGGYDGDCGPYLLSLDNQPISLARVSGTNVLFGRNGNVLTWTSFGEVDLDNFQIFRVRGQERERIAVMRSHGGPASFAGYRFMDRPPASDVRYELEVSARDGRTEVVAL